MSNKTTFEAEAEFKQITGSYSKGIFQRLVKFGHKLNNNNSKLVASQVPSILKVINTFIHNLDSLYPLLKAVFPKQLTLSPKDFHDQFAFQGPPKKAHLCYFLMKKIELAIPESIEVQKFVTKIFKLERVDNPLYQFLIEIGTRVIDEIKSKDDKLNNLVAKDNDHNQTIEQLKEKHKNTIKKKEEEADKLKQKVDEKDKIIKKKAKEAEDSEAAYQIVQQLECETTLELVDVRERLHELEVENIVNEVLNKVLEDGVEAENGEVKQLDNTVKEKDDLVRKVDANIAELNNQIEELNNKNKELNTSISDKDVKINTLNSALDAEKQKEEENLHLAMTLSDREDEVGILKKTIKQNSKEHTKILKETIRQKSKEHRKVNRKLMAKYEKLKNDAIEERRNIIQSYGQWFEKKDREMKNKYSPRLEKPSGFLMDIHGTNTEYAVKKPTETTKASQNKRKRGHNTHPFPSKTKKLKRDDESDNMLASV